MKELYYHNRIIMRLIIQSKFKKIRKNIISYVGKQKRREPTKNHFVYRLNEDDFINLFDENRIESFNYFSLVETQAPKTYLYPSRFSDVIGIGVENLLYRYSEVKVKISNQNSKLYYIHIYVDDEDEYKYSDNKTRLILFPIII